tara:strand:+ start:138 stop:1448 length:1311 start_codon:yes stop_codon:yes gene_type:complete
VLRIGSLNFIDESRDSSGNITTVRHFKHIPGLVSQGAHRPPDGSALHLDGCDCGQGQKLMTAEEYYRECFSNRWDSSRQRLNEISQDVKKSLIGKAVKWPNVAHHPLVCPYASAVFDPNSVLEVGDEKCACWQYNDNVNTNNLASSSGIFVSRPIDGLENPKMCLHNSDFSDISNSELGFSPSLNAFQNGLEGYVLEFDNNGAVYSETAFWKFCDSSSLEIDENQHHLLLLTKKSCIDYVQNGANNRLQKRLKRLMKIINRPWLNISNEDLIPIWYYGKNIDSVPREVRRYFDLFDEFKDIIGPYSLRQQNVSSSTIIRKVLGIHFFHDRVTNNICSNQNPLLANEPFWIQINYLHAFKSSLDRGSVIDLEITEIGSDIVRDTFTIDLQQDAVQIWLKSSDGFDAGNYYAKATARSSFNRTQSYPLGTGYQFFKVV